jgi:cytidine deaminase
MTQIDPEGLLKEAAETAEHAYCPYSRFRVGAALLTADGQVFRGANVENASYGLTVCAERAAVMAAVAGGRREFAALAIVADGDRPAYPCGACRQVIAEFCGPEFPVYTAAGSDLDAFETLRLGELLPKAFGFDGPS